MVFAKFMEVINLINYNLYGDFSLITSRERELFFSGTLPLFWKEETKINKETAKSKKRKFRELQEKITSQDLKVLAALHHLAVY